MLRVWMRHVCVDACLTHNHESCYTHECLRATVTHGCAEAVTYSEESWDMYERGLAALMYESCLTRTHESWYTQNHEFRVCMSA